MQEKFDLMLAEKSKNKENFIYSKRFGDNNANILFKYSYKSFENIQEIVNCLTIDENFKKYVCEIKKDALYLYNKNKSIIEEKINKGNKDIKNRLKDKYNVLENRNYGYNSEKNKERNLEQDIKRKYAEKAHSVLGYATGYQIPLHRELKGHRYIDLIFNKDNYVYLTELKEYNNRNESILRCINEILTYYYIIKANIENDKDKKLFYKTFVKNYDESINYDIGIAIICPYYYSENVNIKPFVNKIKKDLKLDIKICYIKDNSAQIYYE